MSSDGGDVVQAATDRTLNPALGLAIVGGLAIGAFLLLRSLPSHNLSKSDMDRLLFYRYLREKGKLES
jgi:hypothetical protein